MGVNFRYPVFLFEVPLLFSLRFILSSRLQAAFRDSYSEWLTYERKNITGEVKTIPPVIEQTAAVTEKVLDRASLRFDLLEVCRNEKATHVLG